ncbi:conjugal transfer protein TrbJ [Pseudomonas sp. 39004]|uniref:plasmid mobilization protein n=1 Tax=Pseudomonas sp. 39004 TaxID=2967213 RepID=UPI002363C1CE|nr:conjugal transfer protein TrbJ [Pseudomonas sp. 39004]MDD1962123.1 conjugal transfer protein TrbJ [Pseudomonas sp. 39004]
MRCNEMKEDTRKHGKHLRVSVLADEEAIIKENATKASLTVAEYLRRLGLGHVIKGTLDAQYVLQIAKVNTDQGRLGGLIKLWPTDAPNCPPVGRISHPAWYGRY